MFNKKDLLKNYPYKTELHAHTSPVSRCSQISPSEMAETYVREGYDAVVITNHFTLDTIPYTDKEEVLDYYLRDFEETLEAGAKKGLKVYLGTEIRFTENHNDYLIYGVDRAVLSTVYDYLDKGLKKFREEVSLPNSVFLQAHPNRDGMEKVDIGLLDGIEAFNMHPGHNSRNALSNKTARDNPHLILTAGSDFHHPDRNHEASAAMRSSVLPKDSFELAKILKSRYYLLEIGGHSLMIP